jgi:hypothetical protein
MALERMAYKDPLIYLIHKESKSCKGCVHAKPFIMLGRSYEACAKGKPFGKKYKLYREDK